VASKTLKTKAARARPAALDVVDDSIVANADPVYAGIGEFLLSHRARLLPRVSSFLRDSLETD